MTIRPGEDWGRRVSGPVSVVSVADDAEAAAQHGVRVVLTGGDLHRALGRPGFPHTGDDCTELDVDVLEVAVEHPGGRVSLHRAVSSVVAGRWWSGMRVVAILNTGFLGRRNLAPRAHPNDGVFEVLVVEPSMARRERREALHRSLTGSHLPHPNISITRAETWSIESVGRGDALRIDGRRIRNWRRVEVSLHPDALVVVV